MKALAFHLENFEGPLELLLHLISRHKMKVTDIEIGALLTQYLDYVGKMQEANLEISSAFLEMAARLVYIKTVSLLPRHEEAAELKKELEGQLIEYQRAKEAAKNLAALYQPSAVFVRRPAPVRSDPVFRGTASPKSCGKPTSSPSARRGGGCRPRRRPLTGLSTGGLSRSLPGSSGCCGGSTGTAGPSTRPSSSRGSGVSWSRPSWRFWSW